MSDLQTFFFFLSHLEQLGYSKKTGSCPQRRRCESGAKKVTQWQSDSFTGWSHWLFTEATLAPVLFYFFKQATSTNKSNKSSSAEMPVKISFKVISPLRPSQDEQQITEQFYWRFCGNGGESDCRSKENQTHGYCRAANAFKSQQCNFFLWFTFRFLIFFSHSKQAPFLKPHNSVS